MRVLEYYDGVLFLTTNRVGDFDEAFTSRIHMSLYYPELGKSETLDVFKLNLKLIGERFRRKNRKFIPDEMEIGSFVQDYYDKNPFDRWNGRQIRNACQTAVALAEFEAQGRNHTVALNPSAEVRLKASHFETVAGAYLAFSKHLKDIFGTHAARRAKEAGLRAMWVNEKGDIMGSVGPKEAGILKADRKSRFKLRAQSRWPASAYDEPQQSAVSGGQGPPYQGGQGGVQEYNDPFIHPARSREFYHNTPMPQQYNNPGPQVPRRKGESRLPQEQGWGSYSSRYDLHELRDQQFEIGGSVAYPQQRSYYSNYPPKPSGVSEQNPGTHWLPPSGQAPELDEPRTGSDTQGAS